MEKRTVPFTLATVFALGASLVLALLIFICVPTYQDGTWYSYPAYAWSQGGDPSENIPTVMRQNPPPQREVAKFGWENRSNLTVLLTKAWFAIFPPSWETLKGFGIAQLAVLALLIALVTQKLTSDPMLALFATCIVLSDSRILEQALASARPDLFIAVFSTSLLWLLLRARTGGDWLTWAGAIILAICLPMLHSTAANAIAFLLAYLGLMALADRFYFNTSRSIALGATFAGLLLVFYFGKQPILDILIPTHLQLSDELPYRHDMVHELRTIIDAGVVSKLKMETNRWRDYFFMGGVAQFLTVAAGMILAAMLVKRRHGNPTPVTALALFGAFLCAVASVFVFDSHPMVPHALVVAIFGYVASIALLGAANRGGLITDSQLRAGCVSVLIVAGTINAAHATRIFREYRVPGVTNAAEQTVLLDALPATGDIRVIGPTEIWPYLTPRKQPLVLIDNDRARFARNGGTRPQDVDPDYAGARYLVVNKELFTTWHWDRMIAQWLDLGLLFRIAQLGDCTRTVECLQIYVFAPANHGKSTAFESVNR